MVRVTNYLKVVWLENQVHRYDTRFVEKSSTVKREKFSRVPSYVAEKCGEMRVRHLGPQFTNRFNLGLCAYRLEDFFLHTNAAAHIIFRNHPRKESIKHFRIRK